MKHVLCIVFAKFEGCLYVLLRRLVSGDGGRAARSDNEDWWSARRLLIFVKFSNSPAQWSSTFWPSHKQCTIMRQVAVEFLVLLAARLSHRHLTNNLNSINDHCNKKACMTGRWYYRSNNEAKQWQDEYKTVAATVVAKIAATVNIRSIVQSTFKAVFIGQSLNVRHSRRNI